MSISPFSARPASPDNEQRRARLVVLIATLGIAATLLAYAISPTVRHAVSHAAHSVKNTVSRVLDHDTAKRHPAPGAKSPAGAGAPAGKAPAAAPKAGGSPTTGTATRSPSG